jgi:septum formation protein
MHDISKRLILASQSPRRRELMASSGYDFEVLVPSDAAEDAPRAQESTAEFVSRLAVQKARDVAAHVDSGLIIGCDTVADYMGEILGKPRDRADAERMLRLLRGHEHRVYSGLCLWRKPEDTYDVEVDVTSLRMHEIDDSVIEEYLDSGGWIGKAGGFGYQDRTGWLDVVHGSESNVVGLPLERLHILLDRRAKT